MLRKVGLRIAGSIAMVVAVTMVIAGSINPSAAQVLQPARIHAQPTPRPPTPPHPPATPRPPIPPTLPSHTPIVPTPRRTPTATPTPGSPGALSCNGSDRLVTVNNNSGLTIWVAAFGTTDTAAPDPGSCTSNGQCNANEFCDTVVSQCRSVPINGQVSYDTSSNCTNNSSCASDNGFPICYTGTGECGSVPQNGNGFELANNASQQICVPTTWGGRLWARTGCNFTENNNTTCGGTCQGQTVSVGAACATTANCQNACVGGSNNGAACTQNSQCPGVCAGGANNGSACSTGAQCASPGTCNIGSCGKAFCQSGGSCCSTGSCTGPELTCSGGSNAGNTCASGADCPTACAGGSNNGQQCASAADCLSVCADGPMAGESCTSNSDCGSGNVCNIGTCTNAGACTANTYSLYCANSGTAPSTLAELTLAAPGICSGGAANGGPCGAACTTGGGTCGNPTAIAAKSDFFDVQAGIDGANLPVIVTPGSGSYQVTGDLIGVDLLSSSSCTTASDCASNPAPYNQQCFSPTANPKLFGPVGGECAASCTSDSNCTNAPYTKCFKAPAPFAPLASGICINPCTSNTQCANISPANAAYPSCDLADGACVDPYECTSPGCNSSTGACATAGPPGAPFLPACGWAVLLQANCPSALQILNSSSQYVGCASACTQCQPGAANPAALNCTATTTVPWAATNKDLYCCDNGSPSCFDSAVNPTASSCCGYALWATCVGGSSAGAICGTNADCAGGGTCTGAALPQGQATPGFAAASGSGTWLSNAQPLTVQFKNACPTAYSYQYDDSTSTFVCGGVSSTNNTTYTITFLGPSSVSAPVPGDGGGKHHPGPFPFPLPRKLR